MSAVFDQQRQAIAATPDLFLLNPSGNRKFVSGETTRIGNFNLMLAIAAILLLVAIGVAYTFASNLLRANEVEQSGTTTKALIVDGHASTSTKGNTTYYIDYEFKVGGQVYKQHIQIGSALYSRLLIGKTVEIKYLPSDPNVSVLSGPDKDDAERNNGIWGIVLTVPTCLIIAGLVLRAALKNRKLSTGQLLPGTIIGAQGKPGSRGSYFVTVEYSFTNPDGQQLTKKDVRSRPDLKRAPLPTAGTPVTVLYIDDKLQRLM